MSGRREFLKKLGYFSGTSAIAIRLAEAMIWSQLFKSQAQALGTDTTTNYVNINMGGGPPRYMADHWLKFSPGGPTPIVSPYSATNFTSNSSGMVTGQEYRTHAYGDYEVPHLYMSLPMGAGTALLDNMLIVQGYGSGIDGHGINSALQFHPLAAAPSFTGCVADKSMRPFQAARHPENRSGKFVSQEDISINLLNRLRPLNTLLGTLAVKNTTRTTVTNSAIKEHFDAARKSLRNLGTSNSYNQIANENLLSGYGLLDSSLGMFEAEWNELVAKYSRIVTQAMRDQFVPGITATFGGSKQMYFLTDEQDGKFDTGTSNGYLKANSNLIQLCEYATNDSFPIGLALAEFVLRNKLVTALEINAGTIDNLLLAPGLSDKLYFDIGNDMHGGGGYVANLAMLMYHRGILAGVAELQSSLKKFGVWENTHVHITSEFDRKISMKGTGSGHGTEQMVSSLISGKIAGGPYVVGNILNLEDNTNDSVSQGLAAPIAGYQERRPSPSTMCSTMAAIVFPDFNPWKNVAPPLVFRNPDGRLVLPYGKGKVL